MDPRLQPGFLGTNASLMADLTLIAYVLLIAPGMIVGFVFARRKMFVPHHRAVMTTIVLVNWLLIGFLMLSSYTRYVAPGVPSRLGEPGFLVPSVHLIFGLAAQVMGTILLIRMWFEYRLPARLRFEPIKRYMRITLALWLITVILGAGTYVAWYGVPFSASAAPADEPAPVATEEAPDPATGPDSADPEATEEAPDPAGEAPEPEATEEAGG